MGLFDKKETEVISKNYLWKKIEDTTEDGDCEYSVTTRKMEIPEGTIYGIYNDFDEKTTFLFVPKS